MCDSGKVVTNECGVGRWNRNGVIASGRQNEGPKIDGHDTCALSS